MHPIDEGRDTESLITRADSLADGEPIELSAPVMANLAVAQSNLAIAAGLHQLNMTMRRAHGVYD